MASTGAPRPSRDQEALEARSREFSAKRLLSVNAIVDGLKEWALIESERHFPEANALLDAAERLLALQPRKHPVGVPEDKR